MGDWRTAPHILNLSIRLRWVVSFMPWPLYPWGKSPLYSLNRRLGGPQMQWKRENIPAFARNWTLAIQPIASHYTDWVKPKYRNDHYLSFTWTEHLFGDKNNQFIYIVKIQFGFGKNCVHLFCFNDKEHPFIVFLTLCECTQFFFLFTCCIILLF
jgi:hypothetical protein